MIDNYTRDIMADDQLQTLLGDHNAGGTLKARISTLLMVAAWIGLFVLWVLVHPT